MEESKQVMPDLQDDFFSVTPKAKPVTKAPAVSAPSTQPVVTRVSETKPGNDMIDMSDNLLSFEPM